MTQYRAPLPEIDFVLRQVIGAGRLQDASEGGRADLPTKPLAEAARLIESRLTSLRSAADDGCQYQNQIVKTPPGYQDFYRSFAAAGWSGIAHRREYGGGGQSFLLGRIIEEMLSSADAAFALYPALTNGCYNAIETFASPSLKARYLPKLANGEWAGTLCLTEAQAGSNLGAITTRAIPQADGSYRIEGSKIFVTAGDHDLTENIVHFVLARLPGDGPGLNGLSAFLVPKYLSDENGNLGQRNAVRCIAIENKMGMHGSATATLAFEGATGWLVASPEALTQGLDAILNRERISVSAQSLGLCERATQAAIRYACQRQQGRSAIVEYPDVRRMLLRMKAITEGMRVMVYEAALNVDISSHHQDSMQRDKAKDLLELMAPLLKWYCSDAAFQMASLAVQIHGGHGYIKEQGVEQLVRDAKMFSFHYGTNGDLLAEIVGKRIGLNNGRAASWIFAAIEQDTATHFADDAMIVAPLVKALSCLRKATVVIQQADGKTDDAAFGAEDYVRAFALTLLGWNWLRIKRALQQRRDGSALAKQVTAEFVATRLLQQVPVLCDSALLSAKPMLALNANYL